MTESKFEFFNEQFETEVEFARVHTPVLNQFNKKAEEYQYLVTLLLPGDKKKEMLALFDKYGIEHKVFNPKTRKEVDRIRENDNGVPFLRLKRNTTKDSDGKFNVVLPVVDADTNPIPPTTLIGNGSKAVVSILFIKPKSSDDPTMMKFDGIQVIDLVPYEGKSQFSKREGFTVSHNTNIDF